MIDKEAIITQCKRYTDAFRAADSSLMEGLFLDTAVIYGNVNGQEWVGDYRKLAEFCDTNPPIKKSQRPNEIVVLGGSGSSAAVKVEVEDHAGRIFSEFFAMQKIDGRWIVVGKAFSGEQG